MKKYLVCLLLLSLLLCACANTTQAPVATPAPSVQAPASDAPEQAVPEQAAPEQAVATEDIPDTVHATIDMGEYGVMELELYPKIAPQSVYNFCSLARQGYYDGLIFHRVIEGFMIQGGDPTGTGMGGPGYAIKGEFAQNGVENSLSHARGVVSMARSMLPDSAGSQFFIVHQDSSFLDGQYAAFGKVISGLDTLDRIARIKTEAEDRPYKDIVIQSITIDGPVLPEPEKLPE